jgi:hypothetical protein
MVDPLGSRSIFGPSFDNFAADPAFCDALGGKRAIAPPRARSTIAAPVLFITGDLDDRTPVGNDVVLAKNSRTAFGSSSRTVDTSCFRIVASVQSWRISSRAQRFVAAFYKDDPPRF